MDECVDRCLDASRRQLMKECWVSNAKLLQVVSDPGLNFNSVSSSCEKT